MEIMLQILGGIAGVALLYYGAEYLIRGGVSIANKLKIPSLIIGLTLVAFGTSAPELFVSIDAALKGTGDISIGNVVGSNICNIALILGVSATISPLAVQLQMLKLDLPVMVLSALALLIFYGFSQGVERWQAAILFIGILSYTGLRIFLARKEESHGSDNEEEELLKSSYPLWLSLLLCIGGLAGVTFGSKLFVAFAIFLAKLCNVSEAVIGLTVVAVGTSLPELATSVVAAIKKENDIAIGNVVGSNIFNILCILGIAPLISPIHSPGISWIDMCMMVALSLLLYPLMRFGMKIGRLKGAFLLIVYLAYTTWLVINV